MPLARLPNDVSLEVAALLPLGTIARLTLVQKAWRDFVDTNESSIYHNAAALHRFIPSPGTSLDDAVVSLDFDTTGLVIRGWKGFCQVRLDVERSWNGLGPSVMRKIRALGDQVYNTKPIPDSEYTIISSYQSGIAVLHAHKTIWALPPDYLQEPTFFVYDQGYLAFLRPIERTIEIWHDISPAGAFKPSPGQKLAADASTELYGPPDVGHFIPCYTFPARGVYQMEKRSIRLVYPTLLANTLTQIHLWDISTGMHLRTLTIGGELDNHGMRELSGVELSRDFVLAFDKEQVRLFSRHDGNFLFHFSESTTLLPAVSADVQLLPPRRGATSGQFDDAALHRQGLFRKRLQWTASRGTFREVGLSPCGTTLAIVTGKNRIFIVHDLHRLITGDLPTLNTVVEVKIPSYYDEPIRNCPAVTRGRIAVGTENGIIVFTIDRSKAGSGPVSLCAGFAPSSPVQISACFVSLWWNPRFSNLHISGTKLFFDAGPDTELDDRKERSPREYSPPGPSQRDGVPFDDDMPELQPVSVSIDGEEDLDEESDDDVDPPTDPTGIRSLDSTGPQSLDSTGPQSLNTTGPQFNTAQLPPLALFNAIAFMGAPPAAPINPMVWINAAALGEPAPVSSAFVIDMAPGAEHDSTIDGDSDDEDEF